MKKMSDEEAEALDEELTRTVPKLSSIEGPFIRGEGLIPSARSRVRALGRN